jgi:hypothetical protein
MSRRVTNQGNKRLGRGEIVDRGYMSGSPRQLLALKNRAKAEKLKQKRKQAEAERQKKAALAALPKRKIRRFKHE